MTEYTREQIAKARQLADAAHADTIRRNRAIDGDVVAGSVPTPGDVWVDTFTEHLGMDVKPEKPEPGTIGITCDGLAAYVDGGGAWRVILASGDWRNANDADAIRPARVVTAEPVKLSEAEVKDSANVEWAAYRKDYGPNPTWTNVSHKAFHAGYRAALKVHGHGRVRVSRELPTREEVREAIKHSGGAYNMPSYDVDDITWHVMALLGGDDRNGNA